MGFKFAIGISETFNNIFFLVLTFLQKLFVKYSEKSVCITFYRNRSPVLHDYSIQQRYLRRVAEVKDCGVVFSSNQTTRNTLTIPVLRLTRASDLQGVPPTSTVPKGPADKYLSYLSSTLLATVTWMP